VIKLSFGDIVSESFRTFFGNIGLFFHLVTVPWIISILIRFIGTLVTADADFAFAALVEKGLDVVPTTMFLVAWTRVVLLGPGRLTGVPGLSWTGRETAFLIHLVQVAGVTFVMAATMLLMLGTLDPAALRAGTDPDVARRQAITAPIAMGFFVSLLLAMRVSWGLAATAVDVPFSPRLSWAYGRGNGWTIIGVMFLIFFTGAVVMTVLAVMTIAVMRGMFGDGLGPAVVAWTVAILMSYASTAIAATAQAIIFRTLLGWREGNALPGIPTEGP
jgi:hypothetical protein